MAQVDQPVLALTGGRGPDVVVENVGASVWGAALKNLLLGRRPVTRCATSVNKPGTDLCRMVIRQLKGFGSTLGTLAGFANLLAFCRRVRLRPVIDSRLPLAHVAAALDWLESGRQFGTVALSLHG
jgi:NADPH:quinone reductase-like Zn-dependent oxidoreductase